MNIQNKKVVILGAGPSGLIAANYLKYNNVPFTIISSGNHGFMPADINGVKFSLGQRTLFSNEDLDSFICQHISPENKKVFKETPAGESASLRLESLKNKIGVCYNGNIYDYPIQNNLNKWNIKIPAVLSYFLRNRKLSNSKIYAEWVKGNYGNWLSDNIILPHTNKTLKEDLYTIQSDNYGKKVIKFGKENYEIFGIENPQDIMDALFDNVKDNFIFGRVEQVDVKDKCIILPERVVNYEVLINSIALPKFIDILLLDEAYQQILGVAKDTLRWNNMLIVALLIPTEFIDSERNILYFPERDYIFSKVYFQRLNGYSVVTCEISFRENDKRLKNKFYEKKILETVEQDLRRSKVIQNNDFISYFSMAQVIQPAYIICDKDYHSNNIFIQHYLEHNNIFNIGRFAEWKPNLRVEHAIGRIDDILVGLMTSYE